MNDILLTPEESEDARMKAELAVWRRHGDITEQIQAGNEAVLRAQVRKVVAWMKQHDEMRGFPETEMFKACLMLSPKDWAALKAAGEEK